MIPTHTPAPSAEKEQDSTVNIGGDPSSENQMNTAIANPEDSQRAFLKKCVKQFTTQHTACFLDRICDYILNPEQCERDFQKDHPECFFAVKLIKEVYENLIVPYYINGTGSRNLSEDKLFFYRVCNHINKYLMDRFESLCSGISLQFLLDLSSVPYESSHAENKRIAIIPSCIDVEGTFADDGIVVFDTDCQLSLNHDNLRAVRKQLNMVGKGALAVRKNEWSEDYTTIGILPEIIANRFPQILFEKHMEWSFGFPKISEQNIYFTNCFRFHHGVPMIPLDNMEAEINQVINSIFPNNPNSCLPQIIRASAKCKKGGILIISDCDTIEEECNVLLKKNSRGILFNKPICLNNIDPTSDDNTLVRLLNIDGALLIDKEGYCHACGVILDGALDRSSNEAKSAGTPSRGSRYNSTCLYVASLKQIHSDVPILGVVRSEDGMLDFIDANDKPKIST